MDSLRATDRDAIELAALLEATGWGRARSSSHDPSRRGGFIDLAARPLAEDRARDPRGRAAAIGLHARQQADDQHERIESELLGELNDLQACCKIADRLRDRRIEFGELACLKSMGRLIPVDRLWEARRAGRHYGWWRRVERPARHRSSLTEA